MPPFQALMIQGQYRRMVWKEMQTVHHFTRLKHWDRWQLAATVVLSRISLEESSWSTMAGRQHLRSILTHSYLLNKIWEPREALCVPIPNRHVVQEDFGIHTMWIICTTPFSNNQFVFYVLIADKTSGKKAFTSSDQVRSKTTSDS